MDEPLEAVEDLLVEADAFFDVEVLDFLVEAVLFFVEEVGDFLLEALDFLEVDVELFLEESVVFLDVEAVSFSAFFSTVTLTVFVDVSPFSSLAVITTSYAPDFDVSTAESSIV